MPEPKTRADHGLSGQGEGAKPRSAVKSVQRGVKLRGAEKMARIPVKIAPTQPEDRLRKPAWIRAKFPGTSEVLRLKKVLRENRLHTVCEEAACPTAVRTHWIRTSRPTWLERSRPWACGTW